MKKKLLIVLLLVLTIGAAVYNSRQSPVATEPANAETPPSDTAEEKHGFCYEDVPPYDGSSAYAEVNNGKPYPMHSVFGENYSELDALGRCGVAYCLLGTDTMPAYGEKRGSIKDVKPTGWHTVKYDCIEDLYLYNRCHLVAWQLSAENDNPLNLITGTRYMNLAMCDIENEVAEYIRRTENSVRYKVTPVFVGDELVCRGLLIEALSLDGEICCCRFYYNVQPGIKIDYQTGKSKEESL